MPHETPVSTGWVCEDGCMEEPWCAGVDDGLWLLRQGEECECGASCIEVSLQDRGGYGWDKDNKEWVWYPRQAPGFFEWVPEEERYVWHPGQLLQESAE